MTDDAAPGDTAVRGCSLLNALCSMAREAVAGPHAGKTNKRSSRGIRVAGERETVRFLVVPPPCFPSRMPYLKSRGQETRFRDVRPFELELKTLHPVFAFWRQFRRAPSTVKGSIAGMVAILGCVLTHKGP
ncbi:hypothetical protein NDU88_003898 [Pleurodeles waltl]|uniref:Uncharacterized protein n=1 Tax=Pleurodeles waltl TaxID=8319 RepID=A0AAV7L570_PLEWA|nr:hypothetical protein NDU88_003898 [Pleurodeles waltl]